MCYGDIRALVEPAVVRFEDADLARILREGVEPPKQLFEGLVYREGVHWFSGHPGCGKTTLVTARRAPERPARAST